MLAKSSLTAMLMVEMTKSSLITMLMDYHTHSPMMPAAICIN